MMGKEWVLALISLIRRCDTGDKQIRKTENKTMG
jgi:hypothetical protein